MSTAELIWGWTQFTLNVVLIVSSFKLVHDIGVYLKTSNLRCKRLYQKICWEGLKLNNRMTELDCFVPTRERQKFSKLVIELLTLDPKVQNPFAPDGLPHAYQEFELARKIFKSSYYGPKK